MNKILIINIDNTLLYNVRTFAPFQSKITEAKYKFGILTELGILSTSRHNDESLIDTLTLSHLLNQTL